MNLYLLVSFKKSVNYFKRAYYICGGIIEKKSERRNLIEL